MNVSDVRADLERTGTLFTEHEGDPGHLSDYWRGKIEDLCKALEAAPQNAGELLREEIAAHGDTRVSLAGALDERDIALAQTATERRLRDATDEARRNAVQLVAEAVPRMETLNNAMSPGWLARAAVLLGE